MFEQVLLETQGKTRKPWTVCVSFLLQLAMVGVIVTIPLIFTDALPKAQLAGIVVAPGPPPPPPPPPSGGSAPAKMPARVVRQITDGHLPMPSRIPAKVAMIIDEALPAAAGGGVQGGVEGGIPGGVLNSVTGAVVGTGRAAFVSPAPPATPQPVVVEKPKPPVRIVEGGRVQEAKLINKVIPEYPPLARQARIQGTVHLTGIIGRDGAIQQLQVVSGHPLLVPAALRAVQQWRYKPTLLNGDPVEVIAPISVTFILN